VASSAPDGYDELLALARRERELIAASDWDGLAEITRRRHAVMESLPVRASDPAAKPVLEEALKLVSQNVEAILTAIERTRDEIVNLARGRQAVSIYAAGQPAVSRFVDRLE
jgi:hypothetical protein